MPHKKHLSKIVAGLKDDLKAETALFEKKYDRMEDKAEVINVIRGVLVEKILELIRGSDFYSDDPIRDLAESMFLEIFPDDLIQPECDGVAFTGNYYSSIKNGVVPFVFQYRCDDRLIFFCDGLVELIAYLKSQNYSPDEMSCYAKRFHIEDLYKELCSIRDFIDSQNLKSPLSSKKKKRKKKR